MTTPLKDEDGTTVDVVPTGRPLGSWAVQGALLIVAAYVIISSGSLGIWTPEGPGPGFFPLVLAAALALLAIAWFAQTPKAVAKPSGDDYLQMRSSGAMVASLVALGALLNVLGFQLAMLLLLMFHLRIRGRCGWVTSIAVSVLGSVGAFHLFNDFLLVPLPVAVIPPFTLLGV